MVPEKVHIKHQSSDVYLKITNELFSKVQDKSLIDIYSSPFVMFCGTLLEYLLNDILIDYCKNYFPYDEQKIYAQSFINLGFKAKLTTIIPLVTGNKFRINTNSFEYKVLSELITKRNQIAHGKDFYQGLEPENINEVDGSFSISLTNMKNGNSLTFSLVDCKNFMKAINNFYENFYIVQMNKKLMPNNFIHKIIKSELKKVTYKK